MRTFRKIFRRIFIVSLATLICLEIASRLFFPVRLNYNQVMRRLLQSPERIHVGNLSLPYDVHGLYEGAGTIYLNVSANRFIEPEPQPTDDEFRVLFLGGSTTESFYVPQDERWVALINEHPAIAGYNGAQSGANIIDKYHTFEYYTEQGFIFDLVVIMTTVNDYAWMVRLASVDVPFTHEAYQVGLEAYYRHENPFNPLELSNFYRYMKDILEDARQPQTIVEQSLASNHIEDSTATFEDCPVNKLLENFRTYEFDNMQRLYDRVTETSAKLLVMSEATGFLADSGSFETYLFTGVLCDTDTYLDAEYSSLFFEQLNAIYLEAGESVGAETFDLATVIEAYTDSEEGGRYMYDPVHYTPVGSRLVADTLIPVLLQVIRGA